MTFRRDKCEGRWACIKGERYFHKSWIFCLENNFANALTDIEAIIGLALLHVTISFCAWHLLS
jgi:hypothetical protein